MLTILTLVIIHKKLKSSAAIHEKYKLFSHRPNHFFNIAAIPYEDDLLQISQ